MVLLADGVSSLLIDGKLTSGSQGTFPTINPATEEVLGAAADADAEDMGRAIEAARRAFDDTDWSRNTELRVRCIRQLREAMREHVEELREIDHRRGRRAADAYRNRSARRSRSTTWLSRRTPPNRTSTTRISARRRRWVSVPGARSSARPSASSAPITPWNFPHQINLAKIGPALAAGNTVVLKPAPDTPWCAAVLGELITEHTDFPARRDQHRHLQRPRRGRAVGQRPSGGHGFVHRLDGHRPQRDGRRRRDNQEGVPRAGRQVGVHRARRRRLGRRGWHCRVHGVHARRSGMRNHHPAGGAAGAVRRGRRHRGRDDGGDQGRRSDRPRNHLRASDLGATARPGAGLPRLGDRRGRDVRVRRRPAGRPRQPASSSSPPSSRGWTTTPAAPARRSSARC